MESLIGTGTVDACDTIGSGFSLPDQNHNATVDVPTQHAVLKKMGAQLIASNDNRGLKDNMSDMKSELVSMRNELIKLGRIVNPL